MQPARMLDLKNDVIDESDDDLDPDWLLLTPEERFALHAKIQSRGLKLEEAIKGIRIASSIDKSVRYNLLRDAF